MEIPETSPADALLAICLFAAFADGDKSDEEREAVRRIAEEVGSENLSSLSRRILMGQLPLEDVVADLPRRDDKLLAYEMALGVCEAGGSVTSEEQEFLITLRSRLGLGQKDVKTVEDEASAIALQPVPAVSVADAGTPEAASAGPDNSASILNYAILNGALELLPETLATMAIVPLQMKMVYRIGQSHGVELDRAHIKEFLATAGLGLGSQVVEGFARQLMRGLGKKMLGGLGGKAAGQVTGSAFSFASTYAIGHVADKYYAGGRRLDTDAMRALFQSLQTKARELHTTHLPEIQEKARTINPASLLSMVTSAKAA